MAEFASKGVAGTALGLGAGALGVQLLGGGLGNLLGIGNNVPSENMPVNRYEAQQSARIAELETEVKLRDANTYTLGEVNKVRDYVERRFDRIEHELCEQKVYNATNTATISCMGQQISGIQGVLAAITKTVIPKDVICPEVMARYNSWTPPTTETTGT